MVSIDWIVLAGGYSSRFGDVGKAVSKCLMPVAGVPAIHFVMDKIRNLYDYRDYVGNCYLTVNSVFAPDFENSLSRFPTDGINLTIEIEKSADESQKYGSIGAIMNILEKEGDHLADNIGIIAADNIFPFALSDMVKAYLTSGQNYDKNIPMIALFDIGNKADAHSYGVVLTRRINPFPEHIQQIIDFEEKPMVPKSSLVSTAIYVMPKSALMMVEDYIDEMKNKDAMGAFVEWLGDKDDGVLGYIFKPWWFDIGTMEKYREANIRLRTYGFTKSIGKYREKNVKPMIKLLETTATEAYLP